MRRKTALVLMLLGAAPAAFASHGFRPGLWQVTGTFTGFFQGTSRGETCMRHLSHEAHAAATLGPATPVSGPMSIRVAHTSHSTTVRWHDRLSQGASLITDRGWYRFTQHGTSSGMRGLVVRSQTVNGKRSMLRETLLGHWVAVACPASLPAPVFVSSTLQSLNAQAANLQLQAQREQAVLAKMKKAGEVP